jgi:hypothetical protein
MTMKQILIGILLAVAVMQTMNLSTMIHPLSREEAQVAQLRQTVVKVGLPDPGEKILYAVVMASKQTGVPQHRIISLMYTESSFNVKAVSSQGYNGLMQIPYKIFEEGQNTLIGTNILMDKLHLAKGDYRNAVILYKGWALSHPEGKRQADKVVLLTNKLMEV